MRRIELASAIRYSYLALPRPNWWWQFVIGGRAGLLREMVATSITILRREPTISLRDVIKRLPSTPLGRMGAPQEYLYRLVRALRPETVIETGVYRGLSSAFILAALADNNRGQLFSIDLPSGSYIDTATGRADASPLYDNEQVGFAIPAGLRDRWTLILGDVRKELPELLSKLSAIDMFYHDSEHTYELMTWEYESVRPYISAGGLITSDDTNWNSAFQDFVQRHRLKDAATILNRLGVTSISGEIDAA